MLVQFKLYGSVYVPLHVLIIFYLSIFLKSIFPSLKSIFRSLKSIFPSLKSIFPKIKVNK